MPAGADAPGNRKTQRAGADEGSHLSSRSTFQCQLRSAGEVDSSTAMLAAREDDD